MGVNNGIQQHINFIFLSLLSAFMATGYARECYILYCTLFNLPALSFIIHDPQKYDDDIYWS
ncbi:hypothetical protein ACBQ19_03725, partial [Hafnia alvei]